MSTPTTPLEPKLLEALHQLIHRLFYSPDPYPAINSPTSGSAVPGGMEIPVTVSTNRPDAPHYLRIRTGSPSGTIYATVGPIDFSGGSPRTVSITTPQLTDAVRSFWLEIYCTAGGDTHRIFLRLSDLAVNLTADPAPTNGQYEQDRDTTYNVTVSGGVPPYTVTWATTIDTVAQTPDSRTFTATDPQPFQSDQSFPYLGHWQVQVTVTDGSGTASTPAKTGASLAYEFDVVEQP